VTTYEESVKREIAGLRMGDLGAVERQRSQKRLDWLTAQGFPPRETNPLPAEPVTPRRAFELLFFHYMGRTPDQLPVVEESLDRIVWTSANPCPTLDACARLGLDTRKICRAVAERPVQTFLSRVDPRLRFVRDYETIRPFAAHCREQIVRVEVEEAMRAAIAEAKVAKAQGDKGYGALILMGDRELARAHDTGITQGDPSLHAEHTAILKAVAAWGPNLTGALLVSTCEPCPMCAGLAVWSGVTTIMYGSSIAETAAMGRSRIQISVDEIAARSPRVVDVVGGVLSNETAPLYDY